MAHGHLSEHIFFAFCNTNDTNLRLKFCPDVMMYTCSPSPWERERSIKTLPLGLAWANKQEPGLQRYKKNTFNTDVYLNICQRASRVLEQEWAMEGTEWATGSHREDARRSRGLVDLSLVAEGIRIMKTGQYSLLPSRGNTCWHMSLLWILIE